MSPSAVRKLAFEIASPCSLSPRAPDEMPDSVEEATDWDDRDVLPWSAEEGDDGRSPVDFCFFSLRKNPPLPADADRPSAALEEVEALRLDLPEDVLTTRTNPPLMVASLFVSTRVPSPSISRECNDTLVDEDLT